MKPNIIIKDTKFREFPNTREKAEFLTKEEAAEYIEEHQRPNDLVCEFDKNYFKGFK